MDAPKGTLIAYATSPGRVASDGSGRNGLYTQELLKVIEIPGLEIEKAFKRVRTNVARATGDNQIPWESSSLTGDFYFTGDASATSGNTPVSQTPSAARPDTTAVELAYWDSIKDSKDIADFNAYLEQFPAGQFSALARNRVAAVTALAEARKAAEASRDPIEGQWEWFANGAVSFRPDGAVQQAGGARGSWRLVDAQQRKYKIVWDAGWVDDLYLSEDGKGLQGSNQFFLPVSAVRISP